MVRVAALQFASGTDVEENLATCLRMIDRAAKEEKPSLMVLPEFCNHLSWYEDAEHARRVAVPIDGDFLGAIGKRAKKHKCCIVINCSVLREEERITVTSLMFDASGKLVAEADKQTMMGHENDYFARAEKTSPIVEAPFARLGLYPCRDGVTMETPRGLALQGAQVLCNSLNSFALDEASLHIPARAPENRCFVVAANKVGPLIPEEQMEAASEATHIPVRFLDGAGESQIVGPDGRVIAIGPREGEAIVAADIAPAEADNKLRPDGTHYFDARRPELYRPIGYKPRERRPEYAAETLRVATWAPDLELEEAIAEAVVVDAENAGLSDAGPEVDTGSDEQAESEADTLESGVVELSADADPAPEAEETELSEDVLSRDSDSDDDSDDDNGTSTASEAATESQTSLVSRRMIDAAAEVAQRFASEGGELLVLPELFCFAEGRVIDPAEAAGLFECAVRKLSEACKDTGLHIATSLVEGIDEFYVHQGVLIGYAGIVARQPQLHACTRHPWARTGKRFETFRMPYGRLALVVGDDARFPEVIKLAALAGAHLVACPFDVAEPWEVQLGLLSRAAENRVCIAAATRPGDAGESLLLDLEREFTIMTPWDEREFDGNITYPIVTRAEAEVPFTSTTLHPEAANNKVMSHDTDLLDKRPYWLVDALLERNDRVEAADEGEAATDTEAEEAPQELDEELGEEAEAVDATDATDATEATDAADADDDADDDAQEDDDR